jgi:transposase
LLNKLGETTTYNSFFRSYHNFLHEKNIINELTVNTVLIDSIGVPNDIQMPITKVSNHNGIISNEFRIIHVIDKDSSFPLYLKCIPGNIIDKNTLKYTISTLEARKIKIGSCIMDAGYASDDSFDFLDTIGTNYLVRIQNNRNIFKEIVDEYSQELVNDPIYAVRYRDRFVHCKEIVLTDNTDNKVHYAYFFHDFTKENMDRNDYYSKNFNDDTFIDQSRIKNNYFGKFILYSNFHIETADVLNLYYQRQEIEQVFDLWKNDNTLLPVRVHSRQSGEGHILLTLMSMIISLLIIKS